MKIPQIFIRKKLRASTARRQPVLGVPGGMDYEEMSEPNMKLSRALLIVLVLHVVAVAGIIAFNTIKTRQVAAPPAGTTTPSPTSETATAPPASVKKSEAAPATSATAAPLTAKHEESRTSHYNSKTVSSAEPAKDHPKNKATTNSLPADSGKTYVAVKGDNPVTIARKLKVAYDDLIALNHIEDPRKLQIGQKLRIPEKKIKSKHAED
ncbi:MAG: LysM domain-containing protein [Verrucomicrobiota bacterium]